VEPTSAFVPLGRIDLDQILCVKDQRVVGRDNVVTAGLVPLQLAEQPGAAPAPGSGSSSVAISTASTPYGTCCLGRFDPQGLPLRAA
jgi:hypothetical protein